MKEPSTGFCFPQTDCSVAPRSKEITVKCNPFAICAILINFFPGIWGLPSLGGCFVQNLESSSSSQQPSCPYILSSPSSLEDTPFCWAPSPTSGLVFGQSLSMALQQTWVQWFFCQNVFFPRRREVTAALLPEQLHSSLGTVPAFLHFLEALTCIKGLQESCCPVKFLNVFHAHRKSNREDVKKYK